MAGAAGVEQGQPKRGKRPTPRRRNVNGFGPWTVLNQNRSHKYVFVNKAGGAMGVSYYESLGYSHVRWQGLVGEGASAKPKGPYIAGGRSWAEYKPGEALEFMDHVLMSISMEDFDDIQQFGEYGNTGQQHCEEMERRIRTKRGVDRDPLKGLDLGDRDEPFAYLAKDSDEQGDPV